MNKDPYQLVKHKKKFERSTNATAEEFDNFRAEAFSEVTKRYLDPMSQDEEIKTRVRIVLASMGTPTTDENVNTAIKYMNGKDLDVLVSEVTEEKARRRLQRDLRKAINKERASVERQDNSKFEESLSNLNRLAAPAMSARKQGADYGPEAEADIQDIAKLLQHGVRFEKPQGTSLHHFMDHLRSSVSPTANLAVWQFFQNEFQSFVIEHDWPKAFEGVKDFDGGDIRLPFAFTCFEFRISGLRILAFLGESVDGQVEGILATGVNRRWYINPHKVIFDGNKLYHPGAEVAELEVVDYLKLLGDQIRAVCIMLDAGVAVGEIQKAGDGLQKRRLKEGKTPLKDYHVVTLAKRLRSHQERSEPTGTHKRLHWRRGHWRHFDTPGGKIKYTNSEGITVSKTWVNWQLVGDESLGFVDKHYRL